MHTISSQHISIWFGIVDEPLEYARFDDRAFISGLGYREYLVSIFNDGSFKLCVL